MCLRLSLFQQISTGMGDANGAMQGDASFGVLQNYLTGVQADAANAVFKADHPGMVEPADDALGVMTGGGQIAGKFILVNGVKVFRTAAGALVSKDTIDYLTARGLAFLDNAGNLFVRKASNLGLPKNGVDYEKISTAGPGQSAVPRDLNEQVLFDGVYARPGSGRPLQGLNNDPRFKTSDGFQKMEVTHKLPDGTNVTVHYQYNSKTGLPYDVKVVTPQRVPPILQPGPSVTE